MSGATGIPSAASGDGTRVAIATWAPLVVSIISLVIFAVAYAFAYLGKDEKTLTLMAGAAIAMAQSGMNYWTASTSSSRAKDDRTADQLDRQTQALAASVPLAAVPPVAPPPTPATTGTNP